MKPVLRYVIKTTAVAGVVPFGSTLVHIVGRCTSVWEKWRVAYFGLSGDCDEISSGIAEAVTGKV